MVWKWVIIQIGKNCCLMWKGSSHRFKISVLISLNKFWNHSTSSVHVSNWEFCLRPWCIFLYFILYFVLFICRFLRNDWILAFLLMHDSISFLWGKNYQLINMYFPWVQWKSFFPHGKVRHNYLTIGQRFQNWTLFYLFNVWCHNNSIHTQTSHFLKAAGLFKYVWPFTGHQT